MKIGVLSDTHDDFVRTRRGVEILIGEGVEGLIHCGDLCSEGVIDLLAGEVPAWFVFGNNDWDREGLERYAKAVGVVCLGTHGVVELGGRKIGVAHGDRGGPVDELVATEGLRWLLTGHTHFASDEQEGTYRAVNPGALHRTRSPSVCVIDLEKDAVVFRGV